MGIHVLLMQVQNHGVRTSVRRCVAHHGQHLLARFDDLWIPAKCAHHRAQALRSIAIRVHDENAQSWNRQCPSMSGAMRSGTSTQKVLPTPTALFTPISPPMSSTKRRANGQSQSRTAKATSGGCIGLSKGREKPFASGWLYADSRIGHFAAQTHAAGSPIGAERRQIDVTASVNLMELFSRFMRIWRTRDASPMTIRGRVGAVRRSTRCPSPPPAAGAFDSRRSPVQQVEGASSKDISSASIFDKSSTLLMTPSSALPAN